MKYILILNLLLISSACSGMEFLKTLKKRVETAFMNISSEPIPAPKSEDTKANNLSERLSERLKNLDKTLNTASKNLERERISHYQAFQRQNINGVLASLFFAGLFKFNANQSHPAGDAYFNFHMGTAFSLGVAATFAYKFCTTPLPDIQKIEHKIK